MSTKTVTDVRALCTEWADAEDHIRAIDAQLRPEHQLTPNDVARLQVLRAGHTDTQARVLAELG